MTAELSSLQAALADCVERGQLRTESWRFVLIDRLLQRAAQQRPAVAAHLLGQAGKQLALVQKIPPRSVLSATSSVDCNTATAADIGINNTGDCSTVLADANAASGATCRQRPLLTELLQTRVGQIEGETTAARPSLQQDLKLKLQQQEAELLGPVSPPRDVAVPREVGLANREGLAAGSGLVGAELRATRRLRQLQRGRQRQERVRLAIARQPENPGPLNPQMLAIKAIRQMRDLSPDYLARFTAYIDTLAALEPVAAELGRSTSGKKGGPPRSRKR